ncbi:MAG: 3-isopropylmalate dehydrogenase [Proteobacteria bacterium]|nr:3-isopropylmalate dehydrogenase [Pseudomonadota bacterium]MBU1715892.1 3-isopropylmalate dehydrogenase [Pseudomonadota bacterium]
MEKSIAVLEGDGIGPEITREGIKVLRAIEEKYKHKFNLTYAPFGATAYFSEGSPFPDKTKEICDQADAIIKGPVGLSVDKMKEIPQEHRPEVGAILPLRKRYDTYANYRPVRLPKALASFSPLREKIIGDGVDILMIRELVGGIYFGKKTEGSATGMKYAEDDCSYTDEQVRRIAIVAFEEARSRKCVMTNVHKANVLATGRFWNEVVEDVARDYPDVKYVSILVDNAAFQLMMNPRQFNGVMLMENMQGDILTDQAGGVLGSLGLMPSACIGPKKGYVEPAHGSAPDIAGQNKANPYSMIGSVAFLLEKCFGLTTESDEIWAAMFEVFKRGYTTIELSGGGSYDQDHILSTSAFGDMVVEIIRS